MARKVVWSPAANADLDEIEAYSAKKVVAAIRQAANGLVDFPFKVRMIPEFQDPERRETFVYEYRLMYRVESKVVRILRVVHGRRLLKNVPGSFEESPQEEYSAA